MVIDALKAAEAITILEKKIHKADEVSFLKIELFNDKNDPLWLVGYEAKSQGRIVYNGLQKIHESHIKSILKF